jgi:DNA-binding transcriptional LysR family regulator
VSLDLRHARTFVTVAELGTVSKAALRLRIAQPALSRQLIDLEHELGLRLFDRVGRRLLLTGEGEQLLSGCRVLLNFASAVTEQAQLLRHGDTGVLKVAGSPQHIESVLSQFLRRYAQRYSARTCSTRSSWTNAITTAFRSDRWSYWRPAIPRCRLAAVAPSRLPVLPPFRCC